MLAINEIEKSEFTDPIVFKTQEEAPTQSPQNVQVLIEKPNQLIVTWKVMLCLFVDFSFTMCGF